MPAMLMRMLGATVATTPLLRSKGGGSRRLLLNRLKWLALSLRCDDEDVTRCCDPALSMPLPLAPAPEGPGFSTEPTIARELARLLPNNESLN